MAGMSPPCFFGAHSDLDDNSLFCEAPVPRPRDQRIGVDHGGDNPGDAGSHDRISARPCISVMRAWLKGDVKGCRAGMRTRVGEGLAPGVRTPPRLRPA